MPIATSRTSASTASQTLAIALMNEILVARNALDAYLIISADAGSVTSTGTERIFGYSATDMIGQPLTALLPARFRMQHDMLVGRFGASGQSARTMGAYGQIYALRASGEEFPIEATISQSGISPNRLFTVILNDITERRLSEQEREELMKKLELLSERLATAQEEERRKITYELHEELGQELATLKIFLQMADPNSNGADTNTPHKQALAVAMHATERIRQLVMEIEPPALEQLGLHAAIRTYCERRGQKSGWTLHIDAPEPEVRAPRTVERACFRVLQEGLNNIVKHAEAADVWVHLSQSTDKLELGIRDNGRGFDFNAIRYDYSREGRNLGLFGMQIRAKQVGGTVEFKSAAGAGTEIRAVFPLPATPVGPV